MMYANLYELTNRIEKHHETFAGESAEEASMILDMMTSYMSENPAIVGFTFEAKTNYDYGYLDTWITINKIETGWEMIEQIRQEE